MSLTRPQGKVKHSKSAWHRPSFNYFCTVLCDCCRWCDQFYMMSNIYIFDYIEMKQARDAMSHVVNSLWSMELRGATDIWTLVQRRTFQLYLFWSIHYSHVFVVWEISLMFQQWKLAVLVQDSHVKEATSCLWKYTNAVTFLRSASNILSFSMQPCRQLIDELLRFEVFP